MYYVQSKGGINSRNISYNSCQTGRFVAKTCCFLHLFDRPAKERQEIREKEMGDDM